MTVAFTRLAILEACQVLRYGSWPAPSSRIRPATQPSSDVDALLLVRLSEQQADTLAAAEPEAVRLALLPNARRSCQVKDLAATLEKAKAAGVKVLFAPYKTNDRITVIVEFPGGYIAEVHSLLPR